MNETIIVNGIEITTEEMVCKECGVIGVPNYKYLESNKAIQMRCKECGTFLGNFKYGTPETYTMPFGKHKGERLIDLPESYLDWLYHKCDLSNNLYEAVEAILFDPTVPHWGERA